MNSTYTLAVQQAVRNSGLLPQNQGDTVTVALSGGADSVALLLVLQQLQTELGFALQAVHIHHGIRGAEADRDAAFCQTLCGQRQIPFQCICVDVPAYAASHKLSAETAARVLRYAALEQAAPHGLIATAHHGDDQAETLLLHLTRGCGLKGLCGIPPKRGRIIRPLLTVTRDDILAFLAEQQQAYVTDSTNLTDTARRNLLRHEVVPLLRQQNPAVTHHLMRTAQLLAEDEACLSRLAEEAFANAYDPCWGGLRLSKELPKPLRMRCCRKLLEPFGIDPQYAILCAIDALVLQNNGKCCISGNVYAQMYRGMLYITRQTPPLCPVLPMQTGINRQFADRICTVSITEPGLSPKIHRTFTNYALDCDRIVGKPCFRLWQRQDRITLPHADHSRLLRNCIQETIPAPLRRSIYALYDDEGCIFCEGAGVSGRAAPTNLTKRLLVLQCTPTQTEYNHQ